MEAIYTDLYLEKSPRSIEKREASTSTALHTKQRANKQANNTFEEGAKHTTREEQQRCDERRKEEKKRKREMILLDSFSLQTGGAFVCIIRLKFEREKLTRVIPLGCPKFSVNAYAHSNPHEVDVCIVWNVLGEDLLFSRHTR